MIAFRIYTEGREICVQLLMWACIKRYTGYLYTVEFYSVIKKNEIFLFAGKWMELEDIILMQVNGWKWRTRS
jgi:hypothetical protein